MLISIKYYSLFFPVVNNDAENALLQPSYNYYVINYHFSRMETVLRVFWIAEKVDTVFLPNAVVFTILIERR
ncbi:hypothetical protein DESC_610243 [Desulfosarcina cetonica]|nr:hypothetical protein DESC_610243 [Desulfosarcina cetonica]